MPPLSLRKKRTLSRKLAKYYTFFTNSFEIFGKLCDETLLLNDIYSQRKLITDTLYNKIFYIDDFFPSLARHEPGHANIDSVRTALVKLKAPSDSFGKGLKHERKLFSILSEMGISPLKLLDPHNSDPALLSDSTNPLPKFLKNSSVIFTISPRAQALQLQRGNLFSSVLHLINKTRNIIIHFWSKPNIDITTWIQKLSQSSVGKNILSMLPGKIDSSAEYQFPSRKIHNIYEFNESTRFESTVSSTMVKQRPGDSDGMEILSQLFEPYNPYWVLLFSKENIIETVNLLENYYEVVSFDKPIEIARVKDMLETFDFSLENFETDYSYSFLQNYEIFTKSIIMSVKNCIDGDANIQEGESSTPLFLCKKKDKCPLDVCFRNHYKHGNESKCPKCDESKSVFDSILEDLSKKAFDLIFFDYGQLSTCNVSTAKEFLTRFQRLFSNLSHSLFFHIFYMNYNPINVSTIAEVFNTFIKLLLQFSREKMKICLQLGAMYRASILMKFIKENIRIRLLENEKRWNDITYDPTITFNDSFKEGLRMFIENILEVNVDEESFDNFYVQLQKHTNEITAMQSVIRVSIERIKKLYKEMVKVRVDKIVSHVMCCMVIVMAHLGNKPIEGDSNPISNIINASPEFIELIFRMTLEQNLQDMASDSRRITLGSPEFHSLMMKAIDSPYFTQEKKYLTSVSDIFKEVDTIRFVGVFVRI